MRSGHIDTRKSFEYQVPCPEGPASAFGISKAIDGAGVVEEVGSVGCDVLLPPGGSSAVPLGSAPAGGASSCWASSFGPVVGLPARWEISFGISALPLSYRRHRKLSCHWYLSLETVQLRFAHPVRE